MWDEGLPTRTRFSSSGYRLMSGAMKTILRAETEVGRPGVLCPHVTILTRKNRTTRTMIRTTRHQFPGYALATPEALDQLPGYVLRDLRTVLAPGGTAPAVATRAELDHALWLEEQTARDPLRGGRSMVRAPRVGDRVRVVLGPLAPAAGAAAPEGIVREARHGRIVVLVDGCTLPVLLDPGCVDPA